MKFLTDLFSPMPPLVQVTWRIVKKLKLNITRTSLQKDLTEHPDYPSLLSISDVLTSYRIENVAADMSMTDFDQLPLPFIVHIKSSAHQEAFGLVETATADAIELYTPGAKQIHRLSFIEFADIYRGTVLALEPDENAGEINFNEKRRAEKQTTLLNTIAFWILPFLVVAGSISAFMYAGVDAIAPVSYLAISLAGCMVGALLLLYEIDEYNPGIKQICQGTKMLNCSAVLHSKASRIAGLSWSQLGFAYFMGLLVVQLVSGIINLPVLQVLSWLSLATLIYPVFSIYYQWKVVKQWCVLCLAVQALLIVQAAIAWLGGYYSLNGGSTVLYFTLLAVGTSLAVGLMITVIVLPAFQKAKLARNQITELQRLKYNREVFESLLSRQKSIARPSGELGILIGRADTRYRLIKVCNPYCGPCARAHPVIEELVHINEEVSVQVIFTASDDDNDFRAKPVAHLLAIDQKNDSALTGKAMHDWYVADKKEYDLFAAKYPLNGELQQQGNKIKAMHDWCQASGIAYTPTYFISLPSEENVYQLPEIYSVQDLKYFFAQ